MKKGLIFGIVAAVIVVGIVVFIVIKKKKSAPPISTTPPTSEKLEDTIKNTQNTYQEVASGSTIPKGTLIPGKSPSEF